MLINDKNGKVWDAIAYAKILKETGALRVVTGIGTILFGGYMLYRGGKDIGDASCIEKSAPRMDEMSVLLDGLEEKFNTIEKEDPELLKRFKEF